MIMLEKIIASKSKVKLLRKLIEYEDREFCLEDLTKLTGLSSGTVYPALKNITDSRIVLVKKFGKSKVYRINKNHLLFKELKGLFIRESNAFIEIAEEFVSEIDKKGVKSIILFGSVARKEFTGKSDIDFLFVGEKSRIANKVNKLSQQFLDRYDVEISPVFLSVKEFMGRRKKLDGFILNVVHEGMILYGGVGDG